MAGYIETCRVRREHGGSLRCVEGITAHTVKRKAVVGTTVCHRDIHYSMHLEVPKVRALHRRGMKRAR